MDTEVARLAAALKFETKARGPAVWELSRIDLPAGGEAAPALLAALRHPDKHERNLIVVTLGGVPQGIGPVLLEALTQGARDPRVIAMRRLTALGPVAKEAIPALRGALRDVDWIVRRAAFFALRRIAEATAGPSSLAAAER